MSRADLELPMTENNGEEDWWCFLALCNRVTGPKSLDEFFELFLTIEERRALANRFLIIKALLKGDRNQRDIARDVGVSISRVSRGSNSLKTISEELRTFLIAEMG
jgi:TrpR family trp operon transcriptional repressor